MAGLSQEKLADIIGVKRVTLAAWETGRNEPNSEYIRKIAIACGVTTDWLLEMPEDFTGMANDARAIAEKIARLKPEDKLMLERLLTALSADDKAAAK